MDDVLCKVQARAAQHHTVISVDQMLECGADHVWISRRAKHGYINRLGPSVYGMPGVPPSQPTHAPLREVITGRSAVTSPPGESSQPLSPC